MNVRIGLAQHRIGPDMEENLRQAQRAVLACAGQGAQLVLLPEMFCCLYQLERLRACAQPRGGEIWKHLRALACQAGVYLLGGSMPELDAQGRIYNTSFFFSPAGEELACYRKCHLFDVSLPGGLCIQESSVFTPGEQLRVVESPSGRSALPSASIFAFRSNSVRLLTAARSWCWFQQHSTQPQDRRIGRSTAAAARWTIRCFSALVRLRLRRMARIPITAIPWR